MPNTVFTKANNTTELTQAASWSTAGGPPLAANNDLAKWSLGAANTVAVSANTFNPGAISISSGQTGTVIIQQPVTVPGLTSSVDSLPIGTGLYVAGATLQIDRTYTASASQTWDGASGRAIYFGLNGSGPVVVAAGRTITKKGLATLGLFVANPSWAGTFIVEEGFITFGVGATLGTAAVTLNALGTAVNKALYPNVPNGQSLVLSNAFTFGGDVELNALGTGTSTTTLSGSVALGATTKTITVNASTATISGAITTTGPVGFNKAGTGTLTLSAANPNLSGDVTISAGPLTTATSVNALQAATLNWTGTVGTFSPLTNSNIGAIKGSTTTNTLALGTAAINVGGINTSETFSGKFTGSGLITKNGTGTWTLDGDNSGHTGGFTVGTSGAGTLVAGLATALGSASAGAVSVVSGSTLQVNAAISKASATLTLAGTGIGGNGALRSLSGTTSYTASGYTITSDVNIGVDAGTMSLGGAGAVMGTGGINKVGAGELVLLGESNTLDRQIVISDGTLTVKKLASAGTVSSIGRGNTTPAIALTGTLKFDGAGTDSTNRSIAFTGAAPVLEATGSGSITYSASTTTGLTGGRLITLTGTSTSANALTSGLSDGTGAVSLAKTGTGTWNVTGTLAHTGGTTLSEGTLGALGSTAIFTANLNISGGELANGTLTAPVVMTGGTVTATLGSTSTLTVNSGSAATLQPTNNANTFSGATTVAAGGILRLITGANPTTAGAGRVLGTSAVSVSGDIKTSATGAQRGQMRYGGNLTFNTGAKLYVGGA